MSSLVNETYIVACMISVYIYIMFQVTHLRALKLPLVCINSGYAARIFRIILYCDSIVDKTCSNVCVPSGIDIVCEI